MRRLYEALLEYGDNGKYPFHMPGHKRKAIDKKLEELYKYDITEIEGFDNLHNAEAIIKEAMNHAAKVCKSEHTFFLVNGSTCGNLTALSALVNKDDKVLVARNCHKSVYNALYMIEAQPIYIYPEKICPYEILSDIKPKDVEDAINENDGIKAVIITSPTYEGIVSDIKSIAEILHKRNIPLIVDEAHGAHFGLSKFPNSSVKYADIVIQSVHKTLPALTQTAVMHVNGRLVDLNRIKRYLSIYQSSSPSYLLMAAIDRCMYFVEENESEFDSYYKKLTFFYEKVKDFKNIKVLTRIDYPGVFDYDQGKIVVYTGNTEASGKDIYNILVEKYNIHPEMAAGEYCILMTSVMDDEGDYTRLYEALNQINKTFYSSKEEIIIDREESSRRISSMKIKEAMDSEYAFVSREEAIDRISSEYIYLYPPGSPIIVPGEIIDKDIINEIEWHEKKGLSVINTNLNDKKELAVVKNG